MNENYYELVAIPNSHKKLFADFLDDIVPIGYEETSDGFIIRSQENLDTIRWGLEQFAEALAKATASRVEVEIDLQKRKNSDWIRKYQKSVRPLAIPPFYVRPSWEPPKEGLIDVVIDPSLAFGTGHHFSTASCLEALGKYVKKGDRVCDVGCGSGILAIAAAKLGAICDACDTDVLSIANTDENARKNEVKLAKIWEGSIDRSEEKYDAIVANIVADVLVVLARDLKAHLRDTESVLILSGIMDKYEENVLKAYDDCELLARTSHEEWVNLVLRKKDDT